MASPYSGLPDHRFWRRAVARVEPFRIDPVIAPRFTVSPRDAVATAGSCFAQHIARSLRRAGGHYDMVEAAPPDMPEAESLARQFGVFSARTGNIYTVRQLLQLFEEAHGARAPAETAWQREDGRFVDPYRPQIEPAGFASADDVRASRVPHLAAVRAMFARASVFVFTLGLTEAWQARADGAVFGAAPGVAGGQFDPERHAFVNFSAAETEADLRMFLGLLVRVNPGCRVILTVSPVPLIATFEDRHVMVATAYSKAVLRVAAEGVLRDFPNVDYFPSYEIITGNATRSAYYEDDLREITRPGVEHAMRIFLAHYMPELAMPKHAKLPSQPDDTYDVICDEEAIDALRT